MMEIFFVVTLLSGMGLMNVLFFEFIQSGICITALTFLLNRDDFFFFFFTKIQTTSLVHTLSRASTCTDINLFDLYVQPVYFNWIWSVWVFVCMVYSAQPA